VRITADTNILIRAAIRDDPKQTASALKLLKDAELIAVSLSCLCEFAWVLGRVYKFGAEDIHIALTALLNTTNMALNRPAAEAGLAMLKAGGDFADAILAFEGQWLGGEIFASFDKQAVALLTRQGQAAMLLT